MNATPAWAQGKIRVLIVAGLDPVADWMASVVNGQADMAFMGLVRNLAQPADFLEQLAPDVVLLDISSGILKMGPLLDALIRPSSRAAVIIVGLPDELDAVRQAMLHGAQGFLLKPFSESELLNSVRQAHELATLRHSQMADVPHSLRAHGAAQPGRARIMAVYSPKGGVGCTLIAVNLAVALKRGTDQPVVLIDADLRFGDVDTALNILSGPSMAALVNRLNDMDGVFLEQALVTHRSGVKVLTAPPYLDMADEIPAEAFHEIIRRLAACGPGYLIVDTWSALDPLTLAILDLCDQLLVVTTPEVTALRDTHRFLEALDLLHYDPTKILIVLNHPYQPATIKIAEVERALKHSVLQEVSHAAHPVATSLNRGVPLVQEYPDSPPAKDLTRLARYLNDLSSQPAAATQNRKKKLLF